MNLESLNQNLPQEISGQIIKRQSSYWAINFEDNSNWKFHFINKHEFAYSKPGTFQNIQCTKSHPVLFDYQYPIVSIYISHPIKSTDQVIKAIDSYVIDRTLGWRSAFQYFNTCADVVEVMNDGYGLLCEVPSILLDEIVRILETSGSKVSTIKHDQMICPSTALILGDSFIIAESFRFEKF